MEDFRIINEELARYGEPEGRPQLVVLNKCDLIYEDGEIERLKQAFEAMGYEAFPVSAAQNRGFDALLDRVVQLLGELPPPRVFEAEAALPLRETGEAACPPGSQIPREWECSESGQALLRHACHWRGPTLRAGR